ncbi:MAG: arsenate reductase [Woeseia sp.]
MATPPILYGIASCDSCRKARNWLDENGVDFRFHDLRKDGIEVQMLERWSEKIGWEKLLNRQSATWRRIPEADRENIGHDRAIAAMLEHPTLVKRPVLQRGKTVLSGFTEDDYERLFKKN